MLALFFVVASGWALFSLGRRASFKALLPSLTLVTTQFLWFLLPSLIEIITHSEVPQTRYSSGILAVMHSAQYLWITSYYQEKEARAEGKTNWSFARYLLVLVAGGIALFVPGPWIVSRVFHADFPTSFLTFTALVNLHHFILDGAIWKLRDSRIASLLLDDRGGDEPAESTSTGLASLYHWIAGSSAGARVLRVAVVACLLLWGAMDRLHFYWANVSANLSSLQRAARLNPDDSALQTRLARAADQAGQRELALRALQNAAEINPENIGLQEAYARGLIVAGRDQEAYELYRKVLARAPQNANALVNYGLLAEKLGHNEEAIDTWQRAVAADPTQTNAQLYLAQALEQSGETQAAARHYHFYLREVAKNPTDHPGEGETVISALVKVADADAASQRTADAMNSYHAAAQFAAKLKNPSLQSLALVHAAEAQEHVGNPGDAASLFQQALMIDETEGAPRTAAIDWYNYAQFLRRHKQPERLVYACFYRAQDLLSSDPGKELDAAAAELKATEQQLGPAAHGLAPQISQLLSEALSLRPSKF